MPRFYVAKNAQTDERTLACGSLDGLKDAIRREAPGIDWLVSVYDFAFTKESICIFASGEQKATETIVLRLNPTGQVRVVAR